MHYKDIGQRIKNERQKLNLTQYQLAEKVDLSPQYVGKIERGEKKFSFETIVNLAGILNTSLDYLVFGYEARKESPERLELELSVNKLSDKELTFLNDIVRTILVHRNR